MINALLGKKLRQTQTFTENGDRIPVTELVCDSVVVQVKTIDADGYNALQMGLGVRSTKNTPKPLIGHLKKTGQGNLLPRFLQEIKVDEEEVKNIKPGDKITLDKVFKTGDKVKVTGISKSKGFQGGVKRHGFAGGPRTHGQSDRERAPGSIGQTTTPGRVYKGKRMAGRMGGDTVTIKGLQVVSIDTDKNIIRVKGLIPGQLNMPIVITKQ